MRGRCGHSAIAPCFKGTIPEHAGIFMFTCTYPFLQLAILFYCCLHKVLVNNFYRFVCSLGVCYWIKERVVTFFLFEVHFSSFGNETSGWQSTNRFFSFLNRKLLFENSYGFERGDFMNYPNM